MTEFAPNLKLLHHPEALLSFLSGDWRAPPIQIEISPTNTCNAKCDWCFYVDHDYKQKHSEEELPWDLLSSALTDLSAGTKAVTWTGGGDPSVYTHIDKAIELTHTLGMSQGIFTNAYKPLAEPEKLGWIRVTVTEKFIITKHVAKYAEKTKVGVNFNYCAENADRLREMFDKAVDAGVHYFQVRPALAERWDLQKEIEPPLWLKELETERTRVIMTDYKWSDYLQPHGYPLCHGHRFVPFIWHNGDVAVCAYHFGREEFNFGNLKDGGFNAIWRSPRRQQMIAKGVAVIPACQHCCKLGEINKSLAVLAGDIVSVDDKDFL